MAQFYNIWPGLPGIWLQCIDCGAEVSSHQAHFHQCPTNEVANAAESRATGADGTRESSPQEDDGWPEDWSTEPGHWCI